MNTNKPNSFYKKADASFVLTDELIITLMGLKQTSIRPNNDPQMPELKFNKVPGQRQVEITFGETVKVVNLPQNGRRGDHVRLDVFMSELRTKIVAFPAIVSDNKLLEIIGETTIPQNKLKEFTPFSCEKGEIFKIPPHNRYIPNPVKLDEDRKVTMFSGAEIFICYKKPNEDDPEEIFVTRILSNNPTTKTIKWFEEVMLDRFGYVATNAFDYLFQPQVENKTKVKTLGSKQQLDKLKGNQTKKTETAKTTKPKPKSVLKVEQKISTTSVPLPSPGKPASVARKRKTLNGKAYTGPAINGLGAALQAAGFSKKS